MNDLEPMPGWVLLEKITDPAAKIIVPDPKGKASDPSARFRVIMQPLEDGERCNHVPFPGGFKKSFLRVGDEVLVTQLQAESQGKYLAKIVDVVAFKRNRDIS